jgi:hypothetical protein
MPKRTLPKSPRSEEALIENLHFPIFKKKYRRWRAFLPSKPFLYYLASFTGAAILFFSLLTLLSAYVLR